MRLVNLLFILLFAAGASGCKKKKDHPIPSVPVDIQIDLSLPSYSELNGAGGWCYVSGGIRGIIVYRMSADVFVAWERMSPEDPDNACATPLSPNTDNFLQLDDVCSGAKFSMYDGSPISGSDWGLRQYKTYWNGSNLLKINN